ncbi:YybH family protein [Agrobacterium sp. MCAB5]|uniref:YybH family protein n=1 Tax=Agrobacterium sp. MCAB5 TaxID=3233042 RepID=UPI003F91FC3D
MSIDVKKIGETLLELERSANERWSIGDTSGYFESWHEDLVYFDPLVEKLLVGREAAIAHIQKLYKNPHIIRNEYLNPDVIVSEVGDLAVLSYNLNTFVSDGAEGEKPLRAWNCTEVYRLIDGQWRIVHSNWGLTKSVDIASV